MGGIVKVFILTVACIASTAAGALTMPLLASDYGTPPIPEEFWSAGDAAQLSWVRTYYTKNSRYASEIPQFVPPRLPAEPPPLNGGLLAQTSVVPEPSSWVIMLLGMGSVGIIMRRRHAAPCKGGSSH